MNFITLIIMLLIIMLRPKINSKKSKNLIEFIKRSVMELVIENTTKT